MAEPIKIIITQGGEGGEALGSSRPKGRNTEFGTEGQDLLNKVGLSKKEQLALAGMVVAGTRKSIMNSINNTLAMEGNYMESTRIKEAIDIGTKFGGYVLMGVGIAKAVSAGMMSGPMAGFAVAGVVINEGMNIAQQIRQFQIQTSKMNYQAERARIRAGTSLANGSRGTND